MPDQPPDAETLFQHAVFVRSIARGLLRDEHHADDIVQDSMLAALRTPPRGNVAAWLGAVARNLSLMARRSDARRSRREQRAARQETLPSTAESVARLELQKRVVERVLVLPEPYRTTIIDRFLHGATVAELAERHGVPAGTVKTRIRRGLARLRADLDRDNGGRRAWTALLLPAFLPIRSAAAAGATGAILMSTKAKVAILLVVSLLVTALCGWHFLGRGEDRAARALPERSAVAPDDQPATNPSSGDRAPLPSPVDFHNVDRDRDLHGTVVRKADGQPIAGAQLEVVTYPWRRANLLNTDDYDEHEPGPRTTSARDGTFVLRLPPGIDVALRVRAEGYALVELGKRQAGERVRIEMDAGVRLALVTRDGGGKPVPGTRLRLWRTDGEAPTARGVTDEQGRCSFASLSGPAVFSVEVMPRQLGAPTWQVVRLPASGTHEHAITLPRGRTLTGRVTDEATGRPVANARVGMNWVLRPYATTDADGRYSLPGWTGEGVSDIHCVADGYGRDAREVAGAAVHDFALLRGDAVTGRLLGADGRPVAGAPVSSIGRSDSGAICTRSGHSREDGTFLLAGLRRDMQHTLIAMPVGHGRYLLDFDPHPEVAGTVDLGDIELPAPHAIAGRVLTASGSPMARVEVNLSGHNADRGRFTGTPPHRLFYGKTESRRTDDLGRFRFRDLSPGEYSVRARLSGAAQQEQALTLVEGEDRLDVEVEFPEGKNFVVTVVDEDGVPVPRVFVSVATGQPTMNGQSDAAGRVVFFVTDKVNKVIAHPFAAGSELLQAEIPVEGDQDELRVVLKRAATITGRAFDEEGKPLVRTWVTASSDGKQVASALTDATGAFTIKVPVRGAYDIALARPVPRSGAASKFEYRGSVPGVRSGARDIELRVVRVAIDQDRTLRVRVLYPDGSPAAGVRVFVDRKQGTTNEGGVAKFAGLPGKELGASAFRPRDRNDVVQPRFVRMVPTGQEITLTFRVAATISGTVLKPDGTPAAGASIEVREGRRLRYGARADRHGRFTAFVAADEPGPWTIRASVRGERWKAKITDVRTGAAGISLQLK
ncbi:MAG: sigma-70 family RNA polymerase sigma factor [Planctomycetota bacterium]|jgi:RNA polymerase sigma-70 factor (ECF subfamily)